MNLRDSLWASGRNIYGHVHGAGDSATWKVFYNEGLEAKKQKKKFSQADINAKVKLAVEKKAAEDTEKTAEEKNEFLLSCNCLQK